MSLSKAMILLLLAGALIVSCSEHKPKDLIKEDTYINLLVEMQLVNSYQDVAPPDSVKADSLMNSIFKEYGVTKDQFKRSHKYYQAQVKKQKKRIDEAVERLKMDQVKNGKEAEEENREQ